MVSEPGWRGDAPHSDVDRLWNDSAVLKVEEDTMMRPSSTVVAVTMLIATLSGPAKADPLMGSVSLTVDPTTGWVGGGGGDITAPGVPSAVNYSSGLADLGTLPETLSLTGAPIGLVGPGDSTIIGEYFSTNFSMTITFNGADGSHPTVNAQGELTGWVAEGQGSGLSSSFYGTVTSVTVQGLTAGSGIPQALLDRYMDPYDYVLYQDVMGTEVPSTASMFVTVNVTPTPEPATVVSYLAVIAGLGVRRMIRRRHRRVPPN
jgi:hypothetical protein